jgi:hypothetical protein
MAEKQSFVDILEDILVTTKSGETIKVRDIFSRLAGRGYAALFILLSLPFCLPLQIPGFSTPFGILLAFLGLRFAFAKRLWWPRFVLEKKLKAKHVATVVRKSIPVVKWLQKALHPRLLILTKAPILHRLHGIVIFFLALFLSLPLPIPMTNMLAATPIVLIGLGLLEDDGVCILAGYCMALVALAAVLALIFFGKSFMSW